MSQTRWVVLAGAFVACHDPQPAVPNVTAAGSACTGSDLDLNRLLADPACTLSEAVVDRDFHAIRRTLTYRVEPRALRAVPGGTLEVAITLTNVGALPVDLVRFAGFSATIPGVGQLHAVPLHHASAGELWYGDARILPAGKAHLRLTLVAHTSVQQHEQLGSGSDVQLAWIEHSADLAPGTYPVTFAVDWNGDEDAFDGRADRDPPITLTVDGGRLP